MRSGRRVDALDGVRAVAVATVVAVHALPGLPVPGAVGVDVPLVWARRSLRLAPPLFLLVALYPLGTRLVGDDYVGRALLAGQFAPTWP